MTRIFAGYRTRQFSWDRARAMWESGADTYEIASQLGVHESVIYNQLDWWKARKWISRPMEGTER